jgi:uncharacterized YigZ family protein
VQKKDTYKTIAAPTIGEFKDRGSKFIAYTTPLSDRSPTDSIEADFSVFLEKIKKEHPKARHHCFAWRLGLDGNRYRANDDGEPSGTAGRPILGQIDSLGLTNVGVVVVRYFGGTLLGTSGLIAAYRESTAEALRQATIEDRIVEDIFNIRFSYDIMPDVMNALKRLSLNILEQKFDMDGCITFSIRQSEVTQTLLEMKAAILKISLEEALNRDFTEGVEITAQ